MDQTEKILSKIRDIAVKLNHDGAVYTRADLAYELKTCGIANDSVDVSRFVCEAFSRFGNEAIRTSFLTNDGKHTVVDSYMAAFQDDKDVEDAFSIVMMHLDRSGKSLSKVTSNVGVAGKAAASSSEFMSFVTGTKESDGYVHAVFNDSCRYLRRFCQSDSSVSVRFQYRRMAGCADDAENHET